MAEQSCVELAKCAFETKSLDKLQGFAAELLDQPSTDKHFWAYLSLHPEIFFDVYEEEMDRQLGTDDSLKIHQLDSHIELLSVRKQNIAISPSSIHDNWRQFGYDWFLSANQEEAHNQLKVIIGSNVWDTFDRLSKIKGVAICGGLPSKAIYQKWRENTTAVTNSVYKTTPTGTTVSFQKEKFDVDIFIIKTLGKSLDNTVDEIRSLFGETIWVESPNVLYCDFRGITFQIIKRYYSSLNEVLLGFDIDSCAAAYINNNFIVHQRFVRSVKHGANLIIPMRQSASYDFRLTKYLHRGFTIWIPADLHHRVSQRNLVIKIKQLLSLKKEGKVISDYETDELETLLRYKDTRECLKRKFQYVRLLKNKDMIDTSTWKVRDSGTQITGTFNPTTNDYLAAHPQKGGKKKFVVLTI